LHVFVGNVAIGAIAEINIDSTVPKPSNPDVDLAVVDPLEFEG